MDIQQFLTMMDLLSLTPDEKAVVIEKRKEKCICRQCPTYKECSPQEDELLFCTVGRSECITTEDGCLCPTCPFAVEVGLKNRFYCIKGSENQQLLIESLEVRKEMV